MMLSAQNCPCKQAITKTLLLTTWQDTLSLPSSTQICNIFCISSSTHLKSHRHNISNDHPRHSLHKSSTHTFALDSRNTRKKRVHRGKRPFKNHSSAAGMDHAASSEADVENTSPAPRTALLQKSRVNLSTKSRQAQTHSFASVDVLELPRCFPRSS